MRVLLLTLCLTLSASADLHSWEFTPKTVSGKTVRSSQGKHVGTLEKSATLDDFGLVLTGDSSLDVPMTAADLPTDAISISTWVSIDEGTRWGSIVGFYQDNGSYEKGWLLGYNGTHFVFSLSTDTKLHTVNSVTPFEKGKWFHVAGSYDGKTMALYVNGKPESAGVAAKGPIAYPPQAFYTIGAYHDKDEFFRMRGKVHRVSLAAEARSPAEFATEYAASKGAFPAPLQYRVPPHLRFTSPNSATVSWEATEPGSAEIEFGPIGAPSEHQPVTGTGIAHSHTFSKLEPHLQYQYRIIMTTADGAVRRGEPHEFDMRMNYAVSAFPDSQPLAESANAAAILTNSGVQRGVCILIGARAELAYEIARQSELVVFCFEEDADRVRESRQWLYARGVYGTRVSVQQGKANADGIANLLIAPTTMNESDALRLLRPETGVALLGQRRLQRPPLPGAGQWTHQYGNAANSAQSGEHLGGAQATGDLQVQWIGRPGADFGIDRNPRMPAPLSVAGRLFHQGMNRMIALDGYNGSILWTLEIPNLRRVNMPRDASNWCADPDALFVAVNDRCWVIDTATGARQHTLGLPAPATSDSHDWGYVAQAGDSVVGSSVKKASSYTAFWSKTRWYDKQDAQSAAKVCSDSLFAHSKSGKPRWQYRKGAILNSSIGIADGNVVFVESRHEKLRDAASGRIADPELWQQQFLVALDLKTGKPRWEQPIDTADGTVVFYLMIADGGIIIVSSTGGQYHIYNYALADGSLSWKAAHKWPANHHSGHLQHPVAVSGKLFLEPCGYDLASGKRIHDKIGAREGCHTYVGTADALIYRGQKRQIAMWGQETHKVTSWPRLRPSCWLSVIPAAGMLLVPEGGGGCSCGGWMETSLAFRPKLAE
jgi:hypothetical protein